MKWLAFVLFIGLVLGGCKLKLTYISPKGFDLWIDTLKGNEDAYVKILIEIDSEFPSDSLILYTPKNVINATISLVNNSGEILHDFDNFRIKEFKIHTNNLGEIDAWSIWVDSSMINKYWQIYSYSTEKFLIPGFNGRYPGHDQATMQDNSKNIGGHIIYDEAPLEGWKK